jgi:hypothetical protein
MKIGICVPVVVKQKKRPLHHGKMDVRVLHQVPITTSFVVKQATIITPAENAMPKYI